MQAAYAVHLRDKEWYTLNMEASGSPETHAKLHGITCQKTVILILL
jgi:hypothetical protein